MRENSQNDAVKLLRDQQHLIPDKFLFLNRSLNLLCAAGTFR